MGRWVKRVKCLRCKEYFYKYVPSQKYCGSKTLQTGCSHEKRLEMWRRREKLRHKTKPPEWVEWRKKSKLKNKN